MSALDFPRTPRREKFMGAAEQVPRPATPAAPRLGMAGPTVGAANMMGSGSAPIGGTGGVAAAAPAARATLGPVASKLGVAGAGLGALMAGNDIKHNGLGVSNGVDLATSVVGGIGALTSAPVAVGAGALAVGKGLGQAFMPDPVATGLARSVESLASPVQTFDRMRAGGSFLRPEQGGVAGPNLPQAAVDKAVATFPTSQPAPAVPSLGNISKSTPSTPGQSKVVNVAQPARPEIESLDPNSARGRKASANLDSRGYVPASGTGIMRNNSTGAITEFNSAPQQNTPMSAEMAQRVYATSPTLEPGRLPPSLQRDLPSALATFQRAVKTGNLGDIVAARAGLREDAAAKAQAGETGRLGMTLDAADARNNATLGQGARLAAMTARQKQMQDDREFGLKEREFGLKGQEFGLKEKELGLKGQEFGAKRDVEDFTQRETAGKSVYERYAKMFVTPDGKTDTAKASRYAEGVNQALAGRTAQLENEVAKGGDNAKQAAQELDMIRRKGVAAFGEKDLAEIDSLMELGDRQKDTAGLFGGNYVETKNPYDRRVTGRKQNLVGSDTLELGGGKGGTIREADTRYDTGGNLVLPNELPVLGKIRSNKFDLAKGKK